MKNLWLPIALISLVSPTPAQADTLLHCGQLIDVTSLNMLTSRTIRVVEKHITAVESGYSDGAAEDTVLDLKSSVCMPGLMDMHVHLAFEFNPRSYLQRFTLNGTDYAIRSLANAEKTLMAGFTLVRDLGDRSFGAPTALRNAIRTGIVDGPRLLTAGKAIATTGGHADPTNGRQRNLAFDVGPTRWAYQLPLAPTLAFQRMVTMPGNLNIWSRRECLCWKRFAPPRSIAPNWRA